MLNKSKNMNCTPLSTSSTIEEIHQWDSNISPVIIGGEINNGGCLALF